MPKELSLPVDSKLWFDKAHNEKVQAEAKNWLFAPPFDARFAQQASGGRMCFVYFLDYQRCKTLLGEDREDCEFFKKVYMNACPEFVREKYQGWVDEGKFPAHFDR